MRLKIKKSQTEKLLNTLEGGARIGTQSGSARPSLETHGQIVAARENNFLRAFFPARLDFPSPQSLSLGFRAWCLAVSTGGFEFDFEL